MSTLISRLYSWATDKLNGVFVTASRMDAENDQIIVSLNRKVLCASSAPANPINGQTWVDTTNNLVKCYLNNAWVIISNTVFIQSGEPDSASEGYLWYDTANNLLKSYNGSTWDTVGDMLYPASTVQGDILYFTAEKTLARLAKNTNTSRVLANTGSNNNPAWAQVNTDMLKTTTGEVSYAGNSMDTVGAVTLPGGTYGFFPQIKNDNNDAILCHIAGGQNSQTSQPGTSYVTTISFSSDSGTTYAQQRYVTASGQDHWLFLLVDKITKDIVSAYSAPDHPSYGNSGDSDELPHPFGNYDTDKYFICIADKESIARVKTEVTRKRSLLTIVNEDYKVGDVDLVYEPLHTGQFIEEKPVMINSLPDYIKVRKLIKYTQEEKDKPNG